MSGDRPPPGEEPMPEKADEAAFWETPDLYGAYPRLTEDQTARLAEHGQRRTMAPDDVLIREGEPCEAFFVVLSGTVAVVENHGTPEEHVLRVHGPGRFIGELGLLHGQVAFYTAVAREPGEVLVVSLDRLRHLVSQDPTIGDTVLRACLCRRALLVGQGAGFRIVGSRYSPDTRRLREFAVRNRLPHRWIDLETDEEAEELLRRFGVGPAETPLVIWRDTTLLRNPSNAELARLIGLPSLSDGHRHGDVLIVGSGPAGLAAAVYAASEGLSTTVVEAMATGGQAGTSSRIENLLGFPSGISGAELTERAVLQADKFGAGISLPLEATALHAKDEDHYVVAFADGSEIAARAVVLAMGARYRRLRVPGIERLEGTSVHYSATVHEAQQCRTDPVAVVGGGNSAGQAVLFLARYAPKVYLLVRGADLGAGMSRYLVDQVERHPRVEVMLHTEVTEVIGEEVLEELDVVDNRTGVHRRLVARSLFVFTGAEPHTEWLAGTVALDSRGFVVTGPEAQEACAHPEMWHGRGRSCMTLEAGLPGVFAVGDVRSGSVKRVASAAGEGAMAIHSVHRHLGHAAVPGNPGTPTVTGRSDVSPRLRHRESAWLG
ncbi:FAD-dependent oxidoreductase [Streptomyces griseorubiginosus]|uniref:Cyclic nucleotide-binding protein n=1 Tax=Streptomyces griseorubiginosus TaxID=67304 RepID=A0A101S6F3_9ACTN|nr:FAD-dependent oxidoreductase [Streptomyces griseorubiginosus]KUN67988.1 cyclic nucleotide-binding protein [Streptomyces griseorubiginosus]